tara:strand:+ start:270 stop:758 length:489 start_codon:yes stop_codon:yes gene_type:complete
MWIVAKIKPNQYSIFKQSLKSLNDEKTEIYFPKMLVTRKRQERTQNLLGTYIFCFSKNFSEKKIRTLQYIKGLNYFLENSLANQHDIKNFISFCKSFEDTKGILKSSFFLKFASNKFKFVNGPLKNLFFKILQVNKSKIFAETKNNKKIVINKANYYHFLSN